MSKKKAKSEKVEAPAQVKTQVVATVETQSTEVKPETRGRKVNPTSARQQRLAAMAAKVAAGGELKRGRPVDPNSARAKRMAEMEAKKKAGIEVKRGRPAKAKVEAPATPVENEQPTVE